MIAIDIFIIIFIGLVTYGGYKRGVLLEVFDIIIIFLDFGISFHLCPYLVRIFKIFFHWPDKTGNVISFTIIFLALGVVFYLVALTIDRAAKLDVLVKTINSYTGAVAAFIKSWVLLWAVLLAIFMMPLKKDFRSEMHDSFMVKLVKGRSSIMMSMFEMVAPSSVNKEIEKIIKKNKFL